MKTVDVTTFLIHSLNAAFEGGYSLDFWSKSVIAPRRKGDTDLPGYSIGAQPTIVVLKFFIHVLNKRMTDWFDDEVKLVEEQSRFGHSTVERLFTLNDIIQKSVTHGSGKVYLVFID